MMKEEDLDQGWRKKEEVELVEEGLEKRKD
jgi:hypothetical protein